MKYALSLQGKRELREFLKTGPLLAFDFDGTLAPIVKRPEAAGLSKKVQKQLESLIQGSKVAIISGRGVQDLSTRTKLNPHFTIGNHGVEGLPSWARKLEKLAKISGRWRNQIEARLDDLPPGSGVFLENKNYSLALHYRNSRNQDKVRKSLLELLMQLDPIPRIVTGKSVLNLVPAGAPNKGHALLELMKISKSKSSLYVGDDDTDEDVFLLRDPSIFSIRVGQKRGSKAGYYLKSQSEISALLKELSVDLHPSRN